jgi:hypothetical protein
MPSPSQNSVDLPIQTLGGRVTQYDPQTLPVGASPFNEDVSYSGVSPDGVGCVAGLFTRPGMSPFYSSPVAGNPTVNYLKTFIDSQDIYHLLSLAGLNVYDESPCPTPAASPTIIGKVIAAAYAQSDSLLNREWIAFSNTLAPGFGSEIPRQWDGQFYDRVSQCGPGAPPNVADGPPLPAVAIGPAPGGLTITQFQIFTISESNGVCTVFTDLGFYADQDILQVNDNVTIAGVPVGGYNGAWIVSDVAEGFFQFAINSTGLAASSGGTATFNIGTIEFPAVPTLDQINLFVPGFNAIIAGAGVAGWNGTWVIRGSSITNSPYGVYIVLNTTSLANSGGGTVNPPASIGPGLRNVSVSFVTRKNYITRPAPFASWTAAGGLQAAFTNIPTGPSNIVARILIITGAIALPATGGDFFYLNGPVNVNTALTFPTFVIPDNVTTSYTVNFLDAILELNTKATNLFNLVELGEVSTFCAYSERLFACGELNTTPGQGRLNNMEFNGGWSVGTGLGGSDVPLGWTNDPTFGKDAHQAVNGGVWLDAYNIVGDGITLLSGMITQPAYQDFLGVPIFAPNTMYSARVTAAAVVGATTTHLSIDLFSPSLAAVLARVDFGISGTAGNFGATYSTILQDLNAVLPAQLPTDLLLRVYVDGLLPANDNVIIDRVEIFPTTQPYNSTAPRGSYADDPESFDGTTGFQIVGADNGYPVRAMFNLLDGKLYYVKEQGLYSTQDDNQNEPANWPVPIVSALVGTKSPRGVAVGESWAVIAHTTGLWIFWGGEPVKISQEIQPDWDMINWNAAHTIYTVVDIANKRIHVGAPVNGATTPNVEFVCDYSQLANAEGSVSGQDIASHPQAYYSVYNPTKVVAPGKARKWTLWNLTMNCAALTIRSNGSYHLLRGNGTGTGKVYDQVTTQLSDDGTAISGQYQTAYIPQIEDEQALQLGSHRKNFKYLTGYAVGSGVMSFTMFGAQNQRGVPLSPLNLSDPARLGDFEKNTNFVAERASYLFGTNAVGAWFKLTKLCPTLQREIVTPVRGNS